LFVVALLCFAIPILPSLGRDSAGEAFEQAFISAYGHGSEDYYGMGVNGLAARWLPEALVDDRECKVYEQCQFVELVTVENCEHSVGLTFQVVNEKDELVDESQSIVGPLRIGQKAVVEIGTNEALGDISFIFDQAECLPSDVSI
jgi:hypothetical protein